MVVIESTEPKTQSLPGLALRRAWAINKSLTAAALAMVVLFAAAGLGMLIDQRVVTGAPVWLKPAKFAISTSIYSLTLLWLLSFVQGHRRLVAFAANANALGLLVEVGIICFQAARGVSSHFNMATPFDTTLWSTMALFIVVVWSVSLLVAGLLLRQRLSDPAFAWGLRLGLLLAFVGMGIAFFMTTVPTPDQRAAMASGRPLASFGAHSVGVADGGPGLPFVGWSSVSGDLRVPHFVGLHAMQVLPLLGWLLARGSALRLGATRRVGLVWTAGLAYLALILLLTWQALRGQSVVAPDALTLATLGAIIAASAVAVGVLLRPARAPAA